MNTISRTITVAGLLTIAAMIANVSLSKEQASMVEYPEGYRGWAHVKSMVIQQGHPLYESFGGIHHVYANSKALKAMQQGKIYPNGAVLIFDLLEAEYGDNAVTEGHRKVLGVMRKDTQAFEATGGWGFQAFKGNTKQPIVDNPKNACFDCHTQQKDSDYVFSSYRQ